MKDNGHEPGEEIYNSIEQFEDFAISEDFDPAVVEKYEEKIKSLTVSQFLNELKKDRFLACEFDGVDDMVEDAIRLIAESNYFNDVTPEDKKWGTGKLEGEEWVK